MSCLARGIRNTEYGAFHMRPTNKSHGNAPVNSEYVCGLQNFVICGIIILFYLPWLGSLELAKQGEVSASTSSPARYIRITGFDKTFCLNFLATMSLADEETWDVLSHAVAAMQQLSNGGEYTESRLAALHHEKVLESVHGIISTCKDFLHRTCQGNLTCKGCYFSKAIMPTLASELTRVADITL
jgi:hypothetical protein